MMFRRVWSIVALTVFLTAPFLHASEEYNPRPEVENRDVQQDETEKFETKSTQPQTKRRVQACPKAQEEQKSQTQECQQDLEDDQR